MGWVEHRQAWSLTGKYGKWVSDNAVAIQINDSIFLHGGISEKYCKFSLQSLTEQVMAAMQVNDPTVVNAMNDPLGPVWYRGLALEEEEGIFSQTLTIFLTAMVPGVSSSVTHLRAVSSGRVLTSVL